MRVKHLIVGHQESLICYQELGYENPSGAEQTFVLNIPALNRDVHVTGTFI